MPKMNFTAYVRTLVTLLLITLSACSYIKSLFPDKEKDYQYTAEIPPLHLPDDLKKKPATPLLEPKSLDNTASVKNSAIDKKIVETEPVSEPVTKNEEPAAPVVIEAVEKSENISVELIRFNDGENRLRLGVEKPRAWRLVSKALSRKSIEVTNRNQDDGFFVVQYDPNEQKVEDGSLWDEAKFIFRGFQGSEKEYFIKLEELDRKTEVIVLDKEQHPLPDETNGLKLLTLLQAAINMDLAEKK
jgi:outer membrane protein assembly factor BamC